MHSQCSKSTSWSYLTNFCKKSSPQTQPKLCAQCFIQSPKTQPTLPGISHHSRSLAILPPSNGFSTRPGDEQPSPWTAPLTAISRCPFAFWCTSDGRSSVLVLKSPAKRFSPAAGQLSAFTAQTPSLKETELYGVVFF